ncbi:ALH_1b_G0028340.mRNA.1.CDS.1 [Saccharomyces cerevisiae]|nr:ALH_1b_G0028340.mRNA.1.CDS.1 [Saccharomyces cerevisiae]CAI5334048.1 AKR_HP2_G0027310.mRNA.1.CDS.1 [Saccharomyces cerevisiae]CAI6728438.1 ALH_1b_G0028340.mRNA.1.CDS.1 [Saccharomyces cerevisiae]CAI6734591.1 AKR_collapsed_G0028550.mRNA.1.CDS.1 [Saccharomyces cerevisiae]CAI6786084.1 AKR_HP2_G0027310.mRNA.1.CDS.1 [Saccharomyces cerevisiae]
MKLPVAQYSAPDGVEKSFAPIRDDPRYMTTEGRTTGPSDHVLNAGQIDRDKPSEPERTKDGSQLTYLGQLRTQLTGLQDDINEFLTGRMELAKNKKKAGADEKRIQEEINQLLDGRDGDEDAV